MKHTQNATKAICIKGFSGKLSILRRSNFGLAGQESSPQSITAHRLNRCVRFLKCRTIPKIDNKKMIGKVEAEIL